MRNFLENNGVFYHISSILNRKSIEKNGIKFSNKGICVVRTNNMSIINAVINSQIHEIKNGDSFIIVAFKIPKNEFPLYVFEPDILSDTDWTWPLHNILIMNVIPPSFFIEITEYIYDVQQAQIDVGNRQFFEQEDYFQSSFNVIYENHYRMNSDGTLNNLEDRKYVKSSEARFILDL
jgi:hypothetical protein